MMRSIDSHNFIRRSSAFTLIELILAMAMVAMLSLSLFAAMNVAYKTKKAAERAVAPSRAVAIAADLIGRDLESVVMPDPKTLTPNTDVIVYYTNGSFTGLNQDSGSGEGDWIQFFCVGSDGIPNGSPTSEGVRRIDIGVKQDTNNETVLVRRVMRNTLALVEAEPLDEVICRDVVSFGVRYFDGTNWLDEWDSTLMYSDAAAAVPAIPMIVEITLTVKMKDWKQPGQAENTYAVTRLIPLAIAKPVLQQ